MRKIEALQRIPYFAGLDVHGSAFTLLEQQLREERYAANEIILLDGDNCPGLYFLVEGRVRIYKSSPGGREQTLLLIEPGTTFNDVPNFDGGSNPANAAALLPSLIWIVPTATLQMVLEHNPQVAMAATRILAARLRHVTALTGEISLKQVTARVAKILVDQIEAEGQAQAPINAYLTSQLTQQQMATMAGTVREMVGRALRTLQKQGVIEVHRGHISITDIARLRTFL